MGHDAGGASEAVEDVGGFIFGHFFLAGGSTLTFYESGMVSFVQLKRLKISLKIDVVFVNYFWLVHQNNFSTQKFAVKFRLSNKEK